ncbi:uncharacterized protein LOC144662176 isoform X2 [Oculina patagonica]
MAKASSLAEDLTKELECAVCLEQYKEPKVLPCLHSFCKKCLEGLLTKQGLAWKINCPSCRISVEIPQGQVDSLQVNFFLNNLLSMVSLHSERSNVECDNCDSGDPAVNRCTICCHFLCEFCSAGHKRGRSTKTHRLMTLEEARVEGPIAVVRPSFCQEHEGETLKLFCETCDEAICRDCTIVKHRDHKYTFVKDAFAKEKDIVMETLSKTKTKVSALQNSLVTISEMKISSQYNVGQTVQDVIKCFNDLTASLNTRCVELINQVAELGKTKLKVLNVQHDELATALGIVQSSVEFTEKAFKNGSEIEILNMRKQMSTRLQELNAAEWQLEPCADDVVKFKGNDQLKQDIATFGAITDVVTHAGASTITMGHGSEGVMYNTLCGQPIEFTIIAKGRNGQKRTEGGDLFVAGCTCGDDKETAVLNVRDCGDGTYTFLYTPRQEGWFELHVYVMGQAVQGSPFTWFVEKWNLMKSSSGNSEGQIQLYEGKLVAQYISISTLGNSQPNAAVHSVKFKSSLSGGVRLTSLRPVVRKSVESDVFGQSTSSSVFVDPPFGKSASSSCYLPSHGQSQFNRPAANSFDVPLKPPVLGQSASSAVGPGKQSMFGQSVRSSVDPPLVQPTSVGQGLFTPPQQPLLGQPTFIGQSASSAVGTGQQPLFGQSVRSSVDPPQVQPTSVSQGLFTPPQQPLLGQPTFIGQSASSAVGTGQQPLFGQSVRSSVDPPQVRPTSVSQGLVSPPQLTLFGQTTIAAGQSASSPGVLPLGTTSQLHNLDRQLYVVGSASFNAGKHLWKAKLLGNTSDGFSFGIINTGALAKANWWVWNSKFHEFPSSSNQLQYRSMITDCASNDIIEMYLDCDAGTLMIYSQRTEESDIWHGVRGGVCPVFHMTTNGDQVSLLL